MIAPTLPPNEIERLAALHELGILDTPPEERFDRIVRVAQYTFEVPIVLVSLVDRNRQWFKARTGIDETETSRDISFCGYALLHPAALVVPDATKDPRFAGNPMVVGEPGIRFYAGQPLQGAQGYPLGTLCIIDRCPRQLSAAQLEILRDLGCWVETELNSLTISEGLALRRRNEARLNLLMDSVPDGMVIVDGEGTITSFNRAACDMFEFSAQEAIGQNVSVLLAGARPGEVLQHLQLPDPVQGEALVSVRRESVGRRKSGVSFPIELTVSAVGQPPNHTMIGIVHDITARKAAEAELAAALQTQRVANERLETLNAMKSDFVSIVSHEFRTALTGIQGFSEMIRDESLSKSEYREFGGDINREAMRLNRMVTEMLDLDRMESGRMRLWLEPTDVNEVITTAAERRRPGATDHSIELRLAATLPKIRADCDKLMQIVLNLLSNAIKYSPAGGPVVISSALEEGYMHLTVSDRGLGIPEERLETVFDRYSRIDSATNRYIAGTGLGLPIVRQIARLHGGEAWAESVLGDGSTFHVVLPVDGPPDGV